MEGDFYIMRIFFKNKKIEKAVTGKEGECQTNSWGGHVGPVEPEGHRLRR